MKYGYIRISTKMQDEQRQINALLNAGVLKENIFIETASGKNFIGRTEWNKLLVKLIIGDTVIIKELDRLGRNNNEIKETFELLKNKGVFLEILEQPILNTSNNNDLERELVQPLIIHLLGYFAEKERNKILERQKEAYDSLEKDEKGRKISRKKNKVIGRPNKIENLTNEQKRFINIWLEGKLRTTDCVKITQLSRSSLYRIKSQNNNNTG